MFPKILGFLEKRCKDTYKKSEKQEIWAWSGIYYGILWDFRVFGHKKNSSGSSPLLPKFILRCTEV